MTKIIDINLTLKSVDENSAIEYNEYAEGVSQPEMRGLFCGCISTLK